MKLLSFVARNKKKRMGRMTNERHGSIENFGRDQIKQLADKGLGFQLLVL